MPEYRASFATGFLGNDAIATGAAVSASKLQHKHAIPQELAEQNTTIVAIEKLAYIVKGSNASLLNVRAAVITIATDATRHVYVDLQRSTAGGAFSTVMSSTIDLTSTSVNRTAVNGSLASTALVAGDILKWVITLAGAGGAQAKGLIVNAQFEEDYA